jgi:hypothetical protein
MVSPRDLIRPPTVSRIAHINLRVRPALKAKLGKLAEQDRRTLSSYVEIVLEEHVKMTSEVQRRRRTK